MKKYQITRLFIAIFLFVILFSSIVQAGEATNRIKAVTDRLTKIVTDHKLDPPEMAEKRSRLIRETVDMVFDWGAFSQRAMGRHWRKLNAEQKNEFIFLFGQLLERTYMDKTRQYSGEQMFFISEKTDGKYGIVEAKVTTQGGAAITVEFRLIKEKQNWFAYDVYVEGISLVNNYRVQFNNILIKSGFDELINRLKIKLDE